MGTKEIKTYDVVVIGAGSGGLTAAIGLSTAGKSVLLIEKEKPGGECTHSGCVPSKALLHQAKKMYSSGQVDGAKALEITRERIEHVYEEETPDVLKKHGIHYIQGEGLFTDKCVLEVGGQAYRFKKAIIATGSSPRMVSIDGLDESDILTNQNIFEQQEAPKKLLIIGSGPIGMEMAQAFALLGSHVTVASIDNKFARLEEPEIGPILEKQFTDLGIAIRLQSFIKHVRNNVATFEVKDGEQVIDTFDVAFDKVLIAIGRVPNTPVGLELAGIESTRYGITVDKNYRTTNKHVYAIGDVSQQLKFTHTANDVGRSVIKHIVSRGWLQHKEKSVPKVTYTLPEVAQVGLSYKDSVQRYGEQNVIKITVPYSANDRAKTDFAENGLIVVTAKRLTGKILGAGIVGERAGDLLASYTLAIDSGISLWKLANVIYPYPTLGQLVKKSGDMFVAQTLQNLKGELVHVLKKNIAKIVALVFWLVVIWWFYSFKSQSGYSFKDMFVMLYEFISQNPIGPVIYIALYTLRPILFFPATVMTILSGLLFGPILGVIYTVIGENGSANLAYWIGRFFGNNIHLEHNKLFGKWIGKAQHSPFIAVMIMRFVYLPFDLVNYGSGVARIKWSAYALATLIGILPGLITFVLLGASLDIDQVIQAQSIKEIAGGFNPLTFAFSVALFVSSIMFARYYKKRHA